MKTDRYYCPKQNLQVGYYIFKYRDGKFIYIGYGQSTWVLLHLLFLCLIQKLRTTIERFSVFTGEYRFQRTRVVLVVKIKAGLFVLLFFHIDFKRMTNKMNFTFFIYIFYDTEIDMIYQLFYVLYYAVVCCHSIFCCFFCCWFVSILFPPVIKAV